jgi:cytidylate kinase
LLPPEIQEPGAGLNKLPMTEPLVITIDGPAGAGKSTVARMLAERLGLSYVDSGATYRAAALKVLQSGVALEDQEEIGRVVASAEIQFLFNNRQPKILLDGKDVTAEIRGSEVTLAASRVSRLPEVRKRLIGLQRSLVTGRGVVMEGRDIGTVVFPNAPLKIFLQAEPEERAQRRLEQDRQEGRGATLEETISEISKRDRSDSERKASPLVAAQDAHVIDSTRLKPEQVVEEILELARRKKLLGAP